MVKVPKRGLVLWDGHILPRGEPTGGTHFAVKVRNIGNMLRKALAHFVKGLTCIDGTGLC